MTENRGVRFGLLQMGIVLLTLITAFVHLTKNFPDPMFILNGLGYLTLLAALYFIPLPIVRENRRLVRFALMGFTALTLLLWIFMGERSFVGYATKVVEVILLGLLFADSRVHGPVSMRKDQLVS